MATPVAVFAGYNFTFFLDDDGTFTAFGDNSHGQLGTGASPAQVINLIGIPPTAEFGSLSFKQGQILNLMGIAPTEHFGNLTFHQAQPLVIPGFNYSLRLASKRDYSLRLASKHDYSLRLPGKVT